MVGKRKINTFTNPDLNSNPPQVLVHQREYVIVLYILDTNMYNYFLLANKWRMGFAKRIQTTYSREWGGYN